MQKLFGDVRPLDKKAVEKYGMTEDILMENAAAALEKEVLLQAGNRNAACFIVCGCGNNGGDGIALARRLAGIMPVILYIAKEPKTDEGKTQIERTKKILPAGNIVIIDDFGKAQEALASLCLFEKIIIVECLFGSGFHGMIRKYDEKIIDWLNGISYAAKIACDIPGGIDKYGSPAVTSTGNHKAFAADCTITMGALKTALYSSAAKDYTGNIICAGLGISRKLYEESGNSDCIPEAYLLDQSDFRAPVRTRETVHKGTFGHTAVISGEKSGASVIAGSAAFAYGAGLVSLVHDDRGKDIENCPFELMQSSSFPENTTSLAAGMGLGRSNTEFMKKIDDFLSEHSDVACVLDADMFFYEQLPSLLETRSNSKSWTVLTPHPKEFQSMLQLCKITDQDGSPFSIEKILENKMEIAKIFCSKYPGIVLILKDANPVIACDVPINKTVESSNSAKSKSLIKAEPYQTGMQIFINPLGKNCLAKGGSGDVLSGIIAALLGQKDFMRSSGTLYPPLYAALQGSLAHTLASQKVSTQWGMTPFMLIDELRNIDK